MLKSAHTKKLIHMDRHFGRSPLRHLDTDSISASVKAETRNREIRIPPISAYRWWARRTEAINGAIIDAFTKDLKQKKRLLIVDPFAGGGIIPLSAVIRQDRAYAQDINPWAIDGLAGMLALGSVNEFSSSANRLASLASPLLDKAYSTLYSDGGKAEISHTLRVAAVDCPSCGNELRLYPHALVSLKVRRERQRDDAFLACPLGHLFSGKIKGIQACPSCQKETDPENEYTPRRTIRCPYCGKCSRLEELSGADWRWICVLIERGSRGKRELAFPTPAELHQAELDWKPRSFLPEIPEGQETKVLRRHGFRTWNDLYPKRQQVIIESLLSLATQASDDDSMIRVLRLAIIGSAEMAGYLSRWDRFYLKSYESMAGHRFNFTTFTVEPNVWGTKESGRGSVTRRLRSFEKASEWLKTHNAGNLSIEIRNIRSATVEPMTENVDVRIVEGNSERLLLPDRAADMVLTDPPYHDDVQYHELSLLFRAWAGLSIEAPGGEASVNLTTGHNAGENDYADLLVRIFREVHRILRSDGHLIFSYANREPAAWRALFTSLESAGFRAAGYSILHSENETDVAKRDVRACSLDLLMDLVPARNASIKPWSPKSHPDSDEGRFLRIIGDAFLHVGHLKTPALDDLERALESSSFLCSEGPAKSKQGD